MRQQRPRGATTREAVVNAALEVVDRVGVGALTIRAVARRAGAPPMSLYTHFTNKEELLDLMFAEVARRLCADGGHENWQDELLALGHQVRRGLLEHPRWTQLLLRSAEPIASEARERVLGRMTRAGLSAEAAASTLASALLVAIGLTLVELAVRDPAAAPAINATFERLRWGEPGAVRPVEGSRASVSAAGAEAENTFELSMRALVSGLSAAPSRTPKAV